MNRILSRYKNVFDNELGTPKNVEVTLTVKSDAIPKFCRARLIPYALKDRVQKELERLVTERILKPKPDNSVHICGDYKQTVNKVSNCDKIQFQGPRTYLLY